MYPECNLGLNKPYREVMDNFLPNLADYYAHPENYQIAPFCIFGNLYYVGDQKVCMHLIDTGAGLLLFDTGYRHTTEYLLNSIRTLAFDPMDIRYIIHSHGHFDHFGGGNALRRQYGAKIFMSKVDTDLIRERPDRALLHLSPVPDDTMCWPDVELMDGDLVSLGKTTVRCLLTPGHTMGTMTFFFDVTDGAETHRVAYLGGLGFLSVYKEYCREYGLPENKCELMRKSILRVWDEPANIVLGNHPYHNCTLEKRAWMLEHPGANPFISSKSWRILLSSLEERRADFVRLGY